MSSSIIPTVPKIYSGFDPRALGDCALWFDAADTRTIVSSGNNLTSWSSKGSISTSITPTAGTPTTGNLTSNGLNYVNIPLGGEMGFTTALNTQARSWFWVVRNNTPVASWTYMQLLYPSSGITGQDQIYIIKNSPTSFIIYEQPRNTVRIAANVSNPVNTITIYTLVNSATSTALNATTSNGTERSLGTSTLATGYSTASQLYTILGGYRVISLDIFEILFFTRDLSAGERQQVERYLAQKWSITSSFPTGHPYRTLPIYTRQFTPLDINTCQLWLDAADPSTITLSGSKVTQWNDKSGNSNNATQGTDARRPTYANNAVTFVSSNQNFLSLPNGTFFTSPTTSTTIFLVMTPTSTYNLNVYLFQGVVASNLAIGLYLNGTQFADYWQTVGSSVWSSYTVNTTYIYNYIYSSASSNITGLINGSGGSLRGQTAYSVALTNATLGAEVERNFYSDMIIREVIVYRSALTAIQYQQIEGYLAWKWGLQGPNPSGYITAFTPTQISGCQLWLDAFDSSSLTLSGSNVTTWADKSGNGRNATGGVSPTFSNNGVVFNGSQRLLTSYSAAPTAETICIVATVTGGTSRNYFMVGNTGANNLRGYTVNLTSGVYTVNWDQAGIARYASTSGIQSGVRFLTTGLFGGSSGSTGLNGGTQTSASFSFAGTGTTVIGAVSTAQANTGWVGTINEIIIYNSSLTSTQYQQIEGYLANKWGLTNNLPSTHPYGNKGLPSTHPFRSILPNIAPFVPTQINGCQIWFDAADTATITSTGTAITNWANKGNALNITTSNWSNATTGNLINGRNYINFLNGSGFIFTGTISPTSTTTRTYFFVKRLNSSITTGTVNYLLLPSGASTFGAVSEYFNTPTYTLAAQHTNVRSNITNPTNQLSIYSMTVSGTSTASNSIFITGTSQTLANNTTFTFSNGSTNFQTFLNTTSNIGISYDVMEIIIYDVILTASQRRQVEGYLAWKWGIQGPTATGSLTTFVPTQISGCQLWLDAFDPNSFTLSGSNITQWNDKSGNGRHATQYNTGFATYDSTNERVVITTTGQLFCPVPAGTFSSGINMFVVFQKYGANTSLDTLVSRTETFMPSPFDVYYNSTGSQQTRIIGNGTLNNYAFFNDSSTAFRNTSITLYYMNIPAALTWNEGINGATPTSIASGGNTGTPVYGDTGTRVFIGTRGNGATTANVYIYEILMYSGSLTTTQRQQIEGYLANKWGFSSNLPSTHPYASTGLPATHPFKRINPN